MIDLLPLAWELALIPAVLGAINLAMLRTPKGTPPASVLVSVLIPARDEAANIAACLHAALASQDVAVEVLVMDDGSTDATPEVVHAIAAIDPRVRLLSSPALPPGWTGKVHACARLAEAAAGTHLLFIDADVRLAPQAAAAMAAHALRQNLGMVTGVPRQAIGTLGEGVTVPLINYLLVGYLPGGGRAFTRHPALAAACGQLVLVERRAYDAAGGHAAVRGVLHDGLALARRMRTQGMRTEVVRAAPLATCSMYDGFLQSWKGFLKNAREGMATPVGLPIWTILLAGAHLWPWFLLPAPQAILALALTYAARGAITLWAREPWWTVPLHPVCVAVALAIQWTALVRGALGLSAGWKGRAYPANGAA
ncbi:glycosyltransferase [Humitalea sp. 24SJ18S-53]|uniref:glycosyltransferase n=1 Tax=Humitalea sp. 24SJ18S-53 TaxID=3422307 RepID=UPI003D67BE9D